jgi:hypothetical protein
MTTNTIYNFKTTTTEPPDSRKPTPPKPGQITLKPGFCPGERRPDFNVACWLGFES